jgi:hypothetical protein
MPAAIAATATANLHKWIIVWTPYSETVKSIAIVPHGSQLTATDCAEKWKRLATCR